MLQLSTWLSEVEKKVHDTDQQNAVKGYIEHLSSKNLPIIFDINHLSLLVGIKKKVIQSIIYKSTKFYYKADIPKRKGGVRTLTIPFPVLKYIQKWIVIEILTKVSAHRAVMAFAPRTSILKNAQLHCIEGELLSLDIKDFFPSINIKRIIALFIYLGYSPKVSFFLARICCEGNSLPQGAPTSPYLSNLVSNRLDKRLAKLSEINQLIYTRYADDLSFSGLEISDNFFIKVSDILNSEGFLINPDKIKRYKRGDPKKITGISIATNIPKIPRSLKRALRQEIHYIKRFGLMNHLEKTKKLDPIYIDRIRGRLNFWRFIEAQNPYPGEALKSLKESKG